MAFAFFIVTFSFLLEAAVELASLIRLKLHHLLMLNTYAKPGNKLRRPVAINSIPKAPSISPMILVITLIPV